MVKLTLNNIFNLIFRGVFVLRIFRLALSFILIFSAGISYAMSEPKNKQETETVSQDSDICVVCHEILEDDFLDLPCHADSYCHQACFKDWVLNSLETLVVPTCMICRNEVNLNKIVDYDSLTAISKQTYAALLGRRFVLLSLEKVMNYQDITEKGRELAQKMHALITQMPILQFIQTFPNKYEKKATDPFETIPSLDSALYIFEKIKDHSGIAYLLDQNNPTLEGVDIEAVLHEHQREMRQLTNRFMEQLEHLENQFPEPRQRPLQLAIEDAKKSLFVLLVFASVATLMFNDIPVEWNMNLRILVGLMAGMALNGLR